MALERSRELGAKPATARLSAIMALAVCFAAGYLLTRPCSEIRGGLTEQASAAESNETGATEERQTPSQPVSTDTICGALAAAAAENNLPTDFFARLIWQESRFNPAAISRAGAQGVAQFMPATANWRGLSDPFEPLTRSSQTSHVAMLPVQQSVG